MSQVSLQAARQMEFGRLTVRFGMEKGNVKTQKRSLLRSERGIQVMELVIPTALFVATFIPVEQNMSQAYRHATEQRMQETNEPYRPIAFQGLTPLDPSDGCPDGAIINRMTCVLLGENQQCAEWLTEPVCGSIVGQE